MYHKIGPDELNNLLTAAFLFFKHTAIEPLIHYSIGQMQLVCALEKQKLRVTHFIVIFAILQWSGTEPPQ